MPDSILSGNRTQPKTQRSAPAQQAIPPLDGTEQGKVLTIDAIVNTLRIVNNQLPAKPKTNIKAPTQSSRG